MNFLSDNTTPVAPDVLNAMFRANEGFAVGYGDDDWTRSVERRLSELFERDVAAFLVPTGTAPNALALAQLTPPWGAVLCHADSHIATDECGAPEFFGGGVKLVELPGEDGKITAETLKSFLADRFGHSQHQMIASALSITQATEAGTVYRPNEIAALSEVAHERSLAVHMDGARFANAVVRLGATPAQITWQSGVDVLSFGATKAGALAAEAVVFFDPARAARPLDALDRCGCAAPTLQARSLVLRAMGTAYAFGRPDLPVFLACTMCMQIGHDQHHNHSDCNEIQDDPGHDENALLIRF